MAFVAEQVYRVRSAIEDVAHDWPSCCRSSALSGASLRMIATLSPLPTLIEIAVALSFVNALLSGGEAWIDCIVLFVLLLVNGFLGFFEEVCFPCLP